LHICYCHTPARYAWDLSYLYARRAPWLLRGYISLVMHRFRVWDVSTASRVDHFVANSRFVARRIERYYRRSSTVIHPPVDTAYFTPGGESGDYYLMVSRLTAYKQIDLAVEAFNRLGKPLWIVGDGPDRRRLQAMAGSNVRFSRRSLARRGQGRNARLPGLGLSRQGGFWHHTGRSAGNRSAGNSLWWGRGASTR